jgi:hypothetical protein
MDSPDSDDLISFAEQLSEVRRKVSSFNELKSVDVVGKIFFGFLPDFEMILLLKISAPRSWRCRSPDIPSR